MFNVSIPLYDLNGNIKRLIRSGNRALSGQTFDPGNIDDLTYNYTTNSNKLSSVSDATTTGVNHDIQFKNGSPSPYTYDANGNALFIPDKNSTVTYNYLNLPSQVAIAGQNITYLYDASGNKLKKTFGINVSYYQGSVLKVNDQTIVQTGEGRMVYNTSNSKWGYQYDLKDHLGNTRVSFSADNAAVKPLQYKDYYPFGMEMANWYATDVDATKYLYNGKELQDEGGLNWYDYGARFYDPAIGRWHTPDPLCEVNRKWSPYRYAYNNPLRFIDPDGKKIVNPNHYVLSNKKFIAEMKNFDLAVARLSGKETEAFTMTVSGGDRYKKGDKIFSRTNDSEIKNSASKSKHLQSEGAIAVDLATTDISYEILNKAAKESGFRIDPSGSYDDGHFHIDLKDSKYKDEYLKDESIDHNYIPSNEDFEHNKTDNSNKKETKKDNENWQTDNTAKQDATRVSNPWVLINSWLQQNPNINLTIR